jgi:NAD kinase
MSMHTASGSRRLPRLLHAGVRREGEVQSVHHVLNECLLDRGSSPSMVRLELYIDGHHITTVLARTS